MLPTPRFGDCTSLGMAAPLTRPHLPPFGPTLPSLRVSSPVTPHPSVPPRIHARSFTLCAKLSKELPHHGNSSNSKGKSTNLIYNRNILVVIPASLRIQNSQNKNAIRFCNHTHNSECSHVIILLFYDRRDSHFIYIHCFPCAFLPRKLFNLLFSFFN